MDDYARVARIVAEELGISVEEVLPDLDLRADLAADSLHMMQILLAAEMEFDLTIPDEDAEHLNTVRQIVERVQGEQVPGRSR